MLKKKQEMFLNSEDDSELLNEIGFDIPTLRAPKMVMDKVKCGAGITTWVPMVAWARWAETAWAMDAVDLLESARFVRDRLKPRKVLDSEQFFEQWEMSDGKKVSDMTIEEIRELVEAKVLRRSVALEAYLSRVKLFKVPKTELVARLIFACQETNRACESPPAFSLPQTEEIVKRMRRLGKAYYAVADGRHWFYQCKISTEFAQTMAILFEGEILFPNVLPMGHTWAPWAGHHLCWGLVTMRKPDQDPLGVREEDLKELPTIVTLYDDEGNEDGFIVVYIDNMMVATKSKRRAHQWAARISSNARLLRKVTLKDDKVHLWMEGKVEYLGVDYEWVEEQGSIKWRWAETKRKAWVDNTENIGAVREMVWTPRKIASWVGVLMWRVRIAGQPLYRIRREIDMVKCAQSVAKANPNEKGKGWDTMMPDERMKELWGRLEVVREWIKDESFHEGMIEPDSEPTIFTAVDACTTCGRGAVRFDKEGQVTGEMWIAEEGMGPEGDRRSTKCAFVLETRVVLESLKATRLMRGDKVRCASDCVGAIVCILKGYSRNSEACDIIEEIYDLLEKSGTTLEMRWIAGILNIADQPSRLEELEEARRVATWEALKGEMALPRPKGRQVQVGETRDPEFE